MIVVNSLTVTALVCALAKVSATVTATHAPTVSPTVTATNPTAAPTPGPTFPTSVPTSMPTQLQAWTYGDTSSGASCAGTTSDPCGTEYWGNIAGYEMCSTGTAQSPINIASSEPDFELRMPDFHVLHDGCDEWIQKSIAGAFEVSVHDDQHVMSSACHNLYLDYEGLEYNFYQMHFHSPSEHSVGGGYYPAEVHLVHKTTAGDALVLGIFLEVSAVSDLHPYNNSFLDRLWNLGGGNIAAGVKTHLEHQSHPLNPYEEFFPGNPAHFRYDGSLTTPPCTEHVKWLVFTDPVTISSDDFNVLRSAMGAHVNFVGTEYGSTNRYPTRDLHDRHVTLYTDATDAAESRLATSVANIDSASSISTAAIALASISLLLTVGSLVVICSLKSTLDHVTARIIPR